MTAAVPLEGQSEVARELEARALELVQQETALEQQAKDLEAEQRRVQQQQRRLVDSQSQVAERQRRLAEQRREIEDTRHRMEERFMPPSYWTTRIADQTGVRVVAVDDATVLAALRGSLTVDHPEFLGWGRDQNWTDRPYNRLSLARAWRVEHTDLWAKYRAELLKVKGDLRARGLSAPRVPLKRTLVSGTEKLPGALDPDVNESYLLHGTTQEILPQILHEGFNEKFASRDYFGFGSYLAEDPGKSDQYCGAPDRQLCPESPLHRLLYGAAGHPGEVFYVLLCRVCLGFAAHTRDGEALLGSDGSAAGHVWAAARGPKARKRELAEIPGVDPPLRFHSQVVETSPPELKGAGKKCTQRYREFTLTRSDRIYPEYILALQRRWVGQ